MFAFAPGVAVAQGTPPPPAAPSGDAAQPPATAQPPPADASQVQEVTVRGVHGPPGQQEMTSGEVKQMPGAFGDAFRVIEAMPGVTPLVSGLPYFLVRGAPPGNTGFFIDGIRVPALFHLGVGAAVVHPSLIDRVDFYPGGYPARFGRYTGGILSGELVRTPDEPHAEASVRLIDAGGFVNTPFADGQGDVVASGRYGYPGPLIQLFDPDVGLAYWDYQTRVRWRLDSADTVSVFAFGSYDELTQRDSLTGNFDELLGIEFHRIDLRWDRQTSDTGALRVALTLGYDRSSGGGSGGETPDVIESQSIGLRTEWSEALTPEIDARVGADVIASPYRIDLGTTSSYSNGSVGGVGMQSSPFGATASFRQIDVDGGIYGELVWRPASGVELRPGLRGDAFTSRYPNGTGLIPGTPGSSSAAGTFDPRLGARWDITPSIAWIASLGSAHQASNIPLPSPGLQFSQLSRGVQASYQYSTGAEVKLPLKLTATVDAFLQDYTGIADLYDSCPNSNTCTFDGRAVGLELLVRRRLTDRLTGWLSYTLSRTDRDVYLPTTPRTGVWERTLSEFDRTHVVNLALAADLGHRWRAGARLVGYSGLPYSTTTGESGTLNAREPPFFRLDVRLEKSWDHVLGGRMTVVLEWLNALLSKESFGTMCSGAPQQCQPVQVGPITVPSLGVEERW